MTEHQQHLSSEELAGLLAKAQGLTEAGTYHDALAAVREAKKLNPRNVYVLAFERQVEQLIELSLAGKLGDDERTDILESIPGIMDRALAGSGERAMPSAPAPDAAAADRARAERAAAHEWLKNQYFQHAHEYVKKGEYDHALAEIRRVFIIDPENAIARDFEAQIEELSRISRESASAQAAPGMPAPKPGPQSTRPAEKPRAPEEAAAQPRTNGETPSRRSKETLAALDHPSLSCARAPGLRNSLPDQEAGITLGSHSPVGRPSAAARALRSGAGRSASRLDTGHARLVVHRVGASARRGLLAVHRRPPHHRGLRATASVLTSPRSLSLQHPPRSSPTLFPPRARLRLHRCRFSFS